MVDDWTHHRLLTALERETEGETVAWHARPVARHQAANFLLYPFAVPWTGFALFWIALMSSNAGQPTSGSWLGAAFPLFGLPFVLIGFLMLATPWIILSRDRRTLYAATNRRLLKLVVGRSLSVRSLPLEDVVETSRTERADGTGTLTFAFEAKRRDGTSTRRTFEISSIPDVLEAERRIGRSGGQLRSFQPERSTR